MVGILALLSQRVLIIVMLRNRSVWYNRNDYFMNSIFRFTGKQEDKMTENIYTLLDVNNKKTSHTVSSTALTSVNFDAEVSLQTAYETAMQAITIGNLDRQSTNTVIDFPVVEPTNNFALRETKLLVRYTGNITNKQYKLEIGTPDMSVLTLIPKTDFIKLDDGGVMATFKSEFEAFASAPDVLAEGVTIQSVQSVGRNI